MQRIHFITYANEDYKNQREKLIEKARNCGAFDEVIAYTDVDIINTDFYRDNKEILDSRHIGLDGRPKIGFYLWKPFLINETLKKVNVNDIVMYIDCGDTLHETDSLREFLMKKMKTIDMLLTDGAHKNSAYTRMDTFFYTGCNGEHYYNALQIEAGIFVCKKTQFAQAIVSRWLKYCRDRRIISSDANVCGINNIDNYIESRWDQSVLSLLAKKSDVYRSNEMRKFIWCNMSDL